MTHDSQLRDKAAEGQVWPVAAALVLSALLGTAIGWFLLSVVLDRCNPLCPLPSPSLSRGCQSAITGSRSASAVAEPSRALQIDRNWFLRLVDSSWPERFPEREGACPPPPWRMHR